MILLDTQAAVWVALDDRALGKRTRGMVEKAAKDGPESVRLAFGKLHCLSLNVACISLIQ